MPTYNDTQFARIRAGLQIPDTFLIHFDFDNMGAGGGKGGNLLAIHGDYVVKEMNDTDHNTLMSIAKLYAGEEAYTRGRHHMAVHRTRRTARTNAVVQRVPATASRTTAAVADMGLWRLQ